MRRPSTLTITLRELLCPNMWLQLAAVAAFVFVVLLVLGALG